MKITLSRANNGALFLVISYNWNLISLNSFNAVSSRPGLGIMQNSFLRTGILWNTSTSILYCLVYQNYLENKEQLCWLRIYSVGDNFIIRSWWACSGELFSSYMDLNQELFLFVGISKLFSYWKCSTFTINSTKNRNLSYWITDGWSWQL